MAGSVKEGECMWLTAAAGDVHLDRFATVVRETPFAVALTASPRILYWVR
jgi:hypothetical protein